MTPVAEIFKAERSGVTHVAKRPMKPYGKYTSYFFPRISSTLALATLAAQDMLIGSSLGAVDAPTWLSKVRANWNISDLTQGDGPIVVGLAHSDYTAAEIEEWYEAQAAWSTNDKIAQEQAGRKCRQVGTLMNQGTSSASQGDAVLNDGKPVTTKCGWRMNDGEGLVFWAYNDGDAVLITGSKLTLNGRATCRKM